MRIRHYYSVNMPLTNGPPNIRDPTMSWAFVLMQTQEKGESYYGRTSQVSNKGE